MSSFCPFAESAASEWLERLVETRDTELLEEAVEAVLQQEGGYLERIDSLQGLAAIEVLAAALGRPCAALADVRSVTRWLDTCCAHPSHALVVRAKGALARVVARDSELAEFWAGSGESTAWQASVAELHDRLRG